MALSVLEQPPQGGLIRDVSGCPLYGTPLLDNEYTSIREVANGTIANAETLANFGIHSDGAINIAGCQGLLVYYNAVVAALTDLNIIPKFSVTRAGTFLPHMLSKLVLATAGEIEINDLWNLTYSQTGVLANEEVQFVIPNFGYNWVKLFTSSTGVVTSTSLILRVARIGTLTQFHPLLNIE